MADTLQFIIYRNGNVYDSSDYRSIAIQLARGWHGEMGGTWKVVDSHNSDQLEYKVSGDKSV